MYISLLSIIFVHTKQTNDMEKVQVIKTSYKNLTNGMRGTFKLSDGTQTKFEVFENGVVNQTGSTDNNLAITFPHLIELVHFFTNQWYEKSTGVDDRVRRILGYPMCFYNIHFQHTIQWKRRN